MFGKKKKKDEQPVEQQVVTNEQPQQEEYQYYQDNQNAYYNQNDVHPIDASQFLQEQQQTYADPNAIVIIPGRDGVPYNISPKGIENLTRLERLYRNGALSDQTYYNMKDKIFRNFLQ